MVNLPFTVFKKLFPFQKRFISQGAALTSRRTLPQGRSFKRCPHVIVKLLSRWELHHVGRCTRGKLFFKVQNSREPFNVSSQTDLSLPARHSLCDCSRLGTHAPHPQRWCIRPRTRKGSRAQEPRTHGSLLHCYASH